MTIKYDITPTALGQLKQISDHIAYKLCNPQAAQKFIDEVIATIEAACVFPSGFPKKNGQKRYRKLFVGKYIILYRILKDRIEVDNIHYAKRKN